MPTGASLYLCAGMLYLRENSLLKAPLKIEHIRRPRNGSSDRF
jgi:phosphoketolase